MVEAEHVRRNTARLMTALAPMFARIEPRLQATKYVRAVMSDLPKRNGWTIAEWIGDLRPDATQRLLSRARWDTLGVMSAVRRFVVTWLDRAAHRGALAVWALDESGQEKKGKATAGVKRRHMGCAGGIDNGINTVHLAYVRAGTGHALIGSRQWIPAEEISDPVTAITTALPLDLAFATKGEMAITLLREAFADRVHVDFVAGDEVYGSCTSLRRFLEHRQAYVLRVRATFALTLGGGTCLSCTEVVAKHLKQKRKWTIRSTGDGSKGMRTYAWAWIATASPTHYLLIRKHRTTGELAFHYCYVPDDQPATLPRLVAAAGLRWPVEESFEFGKDLFGLDQSQVRLYEAILRHTVLVAAALAICSVSTAAARHRTDTQAPPPKHPEQRPPADPGMIPLTIAELKGLLNAVTGAHRTLVDLASPPSSPSPLIPPSRPTCHRIHPAQLTNGGCRTRPHLTHNPSARTIPGTSKRKQPAARAHASTTDSQWNRALINQKGEP